MTTSELQAAWKPNEARVNYVDRIVNALCELWDSDPERLEVLRQVAEAKLNGLWQFEHGRMPDGHQDICAQAFWDALCARYPSRSVYTVLVVWGETLNPAKDARKVVLTVQPTFRAERIQLNLQA